MLTLLLDLKILGCGDRVVSRAFRLAISNVIRGHARKIIYGRKIRRRRSAEARIFMNILMPREWGKSESSEYSGGGRSCCTIADLGAAHSFSDTTNSAAAKRNDKNAKRSGKMRCSLPPPFPFFPLSFFPVVALYRVYGVKARYKFENVVSGPQNAGKFLWSSRPLKIEILSNRRTWRALENG